MSDHLHLVVGALTDSCELRAFVSAWKQRTGFLHRRRTGQFLWQPSYFDHVLREEEDTQRVVRYVLENPVRRGLVKEFGDYPFCGSDVFSIDELRDFWIEKP